MKEINEILSPRLVLVLFALFGVLQIGCDSTQSRHGTVKTNGESSLPKLKFHQPESYSDAVSRLREIQSAILSDGPLPVPLEFKVLEVIHGEGAGAHSHYHLESEQGEEGDHDHAHGHEGMASSEKYHDVEVDIFTEFVDIVRWLSFIAADGDMPESAWNQVNSVSVEFEQCLKTALNGDYTDEEKRNEIKKKREEIEGYIQQLEIHSPDHSSNAEGGK